MFKESAISSMKRAAEEDKLQSLDQLKEQLHQQHEGLYQQAMQQAEADKQRIIDQATQGLNGELAQLQSVLSVSNTLGSKVW